MSDYPILEPVFIAFLQEKFPDMKIMLAPDEYTMGGGRFAGLTCRMLPVQGTSGFQATLDVDVFDIDRTRLMETAYEMIRLLYVGQNEGRFPHVSYLEVSSLPTLVRNPTPTQATRVASFAVDIAGHYRGA